MKNLNLSFGDSESAIKDVSFRDVVIIGECRVTVLRSNLPLSLGFSCTRVINWLWSYFRSSNKWLQTMTLQIFNNSRITRGKFYWILKKINQIRQSTRINWLALCALRIMPLTWQNERRCYLNHKDKAWVMSYRNPPALESVTLFAFLSRLKRLA